LDSAPGEGKTRFGYNPQAVWKAIAGVGVQPNADPGSGERFVSWPWLTGHISVDLWREYLRKFTLDELFAYSQSPNPGHNSRRKTAFDVISEMVKARMTREEVEELDENGKPTGKKVHSREFDLLKDRGIKILSVGIRSLRFPAEVEKQLVDQWVGTWLQRAQEDVRQADQAQSEERNNGLELALKDYAAACSQNLANVLANDLTVGMTPSLEHLVRGTLKLSIREIELNPRLTNQKTNLVELLDWIRKE
jgi:hypothetical protein